MFSKILVANRGEIALRVIRACRELGIPAVAVHSTADTNAMHVRMADESVCIGPPRVDKSYLSMPAIISACQITGSDALHPGYGFLSENAEFARVLAEHGITFIGPASEHIALMGDKISAKRAMEGHGLQCVPGSEGLIPTLGDALSQAETIGYPVLVKAAAGGGGRGMKVVRDQWEMEGAFSTARLEAKAAFGSDEVYIEKFLVNPRHIEIQIFGDGKGEAVHLGERDCSLQRRHQKVLEEAPGPRIGERERRIIGQRSAAAIRSLGYSGAGTIEYLYASGEFYFIEMNTRLQVEHPVTEAVYGLDLVQEQIRVAAGLPLSFCQSDMSIRGHAIEVRINAERYPDFMPSTGKVRNLHAPGGLGVRFDSALFSGSEILPYYDSLVGKLIVHGSDRRSAVARLARSLQELVIDGIETNAPMFLDLVDEQDFLEGQYDIHWLEEWLARKA